MFTIFLTHARADAAVARELAGFLERGMGEGVLVDAAEIGEDENLLDKTGEGLSASAILVLLSPESVPRQWVRNEWVRAFMDEPREAEVPVGFVQVRECRFPELLRRNRFFRLDGDGLRAFRAVKTWMLELQAIRPEPRAPLPCPAAHGRREEDVEALQKEIADEPGFAVISGPGGAGKTSLALEFARRHEAEFEWVAWLNCEGRGAAGVLGDLAAQLGLRMESAYEASAESTRRFIAGRRFLIVLDGAGSEAADLLPSGRSSILLTTRRGEDWRRAGPAEVRLEGAPFDLSQLEEAERALLETIAAGAPTGCRLALAGGNPEQAARLAERGLVLSFGDRMVVPRFVHESVRPPAIARRNHAQAVARDLAAHATTGGYDDFANAQHAVRWCFSDDGHDDAWRLGYDIAWRSALLLRDAYRMPEAVESLKLLLARAEEKQDRDWMRSATQELIWTLSRWGDAEGAADFEKVLRDSCDDQLWLPFAT